MVSTATWLGHWVSSEAEPITNPDGSIIYSRRDFHFENKIWKLIFTAWGDKDLHYKLFTLRIEGEYELRGNSQVVPEAHQADFHFYRRYFTVHAQPLLDGLKGVTGEKGAWALDQEQEITRTGALFIPPLSPGHTEFDLLKLEGEKLFLGDRSQDLTVPENRPKKLIAFPLARK